MRESKSEEDEYWTFTNTFTVPIEDAPLSLSDVPLDYLRSQVARVARRIVPSTMRLVREDGPAVGTADPQLAYYRVTAACEPAPMAVVVADDVESARRHADEIWPDLSLGTLRTLCSRDDLRMLYGKRLIPLTVAPGTQVQPWHREIDAFRRAGRVVIVEPTAVTTANSVTAAQ